MAYPIVLWPEVNVVVAKYKKCVCIYVSQTQAMIAILSEAFLIPWDTAQSSYDTHTFPTL